MVGKIGYDLDEYLENQEKNSENENDPFSQPILAPMKKRKTNIPKRKNKFRKSRKHKHSDHNKNYFPSSFTRQKRGGGSIAPIPMPMPYANYLQDQFPYIKC